MRQRSFFLLPRLPLLIAVAIGMCAVTLLLSSCKQQQIPLIEQQCGTCHSASVVYQTRRTQEGRRQVMHGMKIRGLDISPQEEEQVYAVLFSEFLLE